MILVGVALAIDGTVVEADTGRPVPHAEVIVGTTVTTTDDRGRFSLDAPTGATVAFRAHGFGEIVLTVPEDGPWRVRLPAEASALEIVVEARRDEPVVSVTSLDRERVLRTPGTFEDPVRLVQALPGVSITPEYSPKAGDIAIRGAAPGESRFLLDGIDLPYLFHFNGYSSVFHTRMLDELTLWPSTYGAAWGGAAGGVIETKSRWDRPESVSGSVNANFIMAGAELTVPVAERFALRASGRRSYLDAFSREDEQYTVFPRFWDWFGRAEWTPGPGRAWGLVGFGAGDAYTRYAGEPTELSGWEDEVNPVFIYDQRFQVVGLVHHELVGRTRVDGVLAYVDHREAGALPEASESFVERTLQLREDVQSAPTDVLTLAFGGELRGSATEILATTERAWPEVAREAELLGRGTPADVATERVIGGAYAEARVRIGPMRLVPGVRADADTLTGIPTVDPRFLVRWELGPDTRVRVGAGSYSQFPSVGDATIGLADPRPARSEQAAIGFDHAFAGRLELGIDGWAARMRQLVLTEPDGSVVAASGEAWGFELTSRYRLRDRFFASASVAAGHATRGGVTFDYDQPVAANLAASWTFRPTWNVGVRYRLASGLPYTPIVDGLYLAASDTYTPAYGATNSERHPPYQKVDGHLEKTFHAGKVAVTAYTELWWVPTGSNVMYLAYRYDYDESAPVAGPPFIGLLGLRAER